MNDYEKWIEDYKRIYNQTDWATIVYCLVVGLLIIVVLWQGALLFHNMD